MPCWLKILTVALVFAAVSIPTIAGAQTSELTAADRQALLYTSQLVFDASGEPIVKIGIADNLDTVEFTPDATFRVLPTGPGGPELELPGNRTYTIKNTGGEGGKYRHFVVLSRLHHGEENALTEALAFWSQNNIEHDVVELGSLFAVSGTMFDSRETLVVSQPFESVRKAQKFRRAMVEKHGVDASIHTEMTEYPSATLELEGAGESITLRHQDVLWIDLGKRGTAEVSDVPTEKGTRQDRTYAETLIFTPDRDGRLAMVNGVRVETALRGIVPAEIYSTAPIEALKVQAIAARGTMMSQIGERHLADPFNLCDEQHCQVFNGMNASKASTDEAIAETTGEILFAGKRIAETYYSSNCGGVSANGEAVWGLPPRAYLHAHMDTADAFNASVDTSRADDVPPSLGRELPASEDEWRSFLTSSPESFSNTTRYSSGKNFRWTKTLTAAEVTQFVDKRYDIGDVVDLEIDSRGPGGRVIELAIIGTDGNAIIERELPIRRLFGGLKSGLFVLDIERDSTGAATSFTFVGGGYGHGVGMCQTGAMNMAAEGHSHREILDHYYRGSVVRDVW